MLFFSAAKLHKNYSFYRLIEIELTFIITFFDQNEYFCGHKANEWTLSNEKMHLFNWVNF